MLVVFFCKVREDKSVCSRGFIHQETEKRFVFQPGFAVIFREPICALLATFTDLCTLSVSSLQLALLHFVLI